MENGQKDETDVLAADGQNIEFFLKSRTSQLKRGKSTSTQKWYKNKKMGDPVRKQNRHIKINAYEFKIFECQLCSIDTII